MRKEVEHRQVLSREKRGGGFLEKRKTWAVVGCEKAMLFHIWLGKAGRGRGRKGRREGKREGRGEQEIRAGALLGENLPRGQVSSANSAPDHMLRRGATQRWCTAIPIPATGDGSHGGHGHHEACRIDDPFLGWSLRGRGWFCPKVIGEAIASGQGDEQQGKEDEAHGKGSLVVGERWEEVGRDKSVFSCEDAYNMESTKRECVE
jgi:hypothetical protein